MFNKTKFKAGFTLVELSIVLIIIGLIVGGVLVGQDLIKQAKVTKLVNMKNELVTGYFTFYTKYNGLPGDITNATDLWPSDVTRNGNGNGLIDYGDNGGSWRDYTLAFLNLELAGLIPAAIGGANYTGTVPYSVGVSVPKMNYDDVGFELRYQTTSYGEPGFEDSHRILIGDNGAGTLLRGFLTPLEMYGIDKKYDDGIPAEGIIRPTASGTIDLPSSNANRCNRYLSAASQWYYLDYDAATCAIYELVKF